MARRHRRFMRQDTEYVWCGLLTNANALASGAAEEHFVVGGSDWFGASGQGEAVLQRIRGSVSFAQTPNTESTAGFWQVAVYKCDADALTFAVPMTVTDLVDEDMLWFEQGSMVRSVTGVALPDPIRVILDIKTKRRIKSSDQIRVMLAVSQASTYQIATRALVKL